ncbi:sulfotransferase family protein [Methylovulum miyakonense]|uniref:sulfotransferase family protein n=1 Tax=Methylovulum miyakonense TaxID=645578 RepID=UPI00037562FB|nr:sulfotransferase family protein [Methylovulum miyakonense]
MKKNNTGYSTLNGDASGLAQKTVLVLGIGRGGTSMVAGVLSKLGIYMGDGLSSRYQDTALLDCLKRNDKKQAKKIIKERDGKYPVWGIKKLRLWRWNRLFRQPVYVVILRDIFATANRRMSIFNISLLSEMFKVLGLNFKLLLFLRFTKRPVFIASYEKALLFPEDFVAGLAEFLGLDDPTQIAEAVEFIKPSPPTYTNTLVNFKAIKKNKDYVGYIDALASNRVSGWALSTLHRDPVSLELLVNGVLVQTITTYLSRPDVPKRNKRFHELCGFEFRLPDGVLLETGDQIDVRFEGHQQSLNNSPQEFV